MGGGHRQLWLRAGMIYKLLAFAARAPWEGLGEATEMEKG